MEIINTILSMLFEKRVDKNRNYSRKEINKNFSRAKNEMYKTILKTGSATDGYTKKKLDLGGKWDYDHVVPAKKSFDFFKDKHTNEEIARITNVRKNIVTTERTINRTKGKNELNKISGKLIGLGADPKSMKKVENESWKNMQQESKKILIEKKKGWFARLFN